MGYLARKAAPTFIAGPQEDLAAQDVYRINDNRAINNGTSAKATPTITESIMGLMGSTAITAAAVKLANPAGALTAASIMTPNLISRVSAVAGGVINSGLNSLPAGLKDGLNGALNVAAPILATVGNVQRMIPNANVAGAGALSNMMSNLARNTAGNGLPNLPGLKLSDPTGLTSAASGLIGANARIGIPGSFGQVAPQMLSTLGGTNLGGNALLNQIAGNTLSNVLRGSDIQSLKSMGAMTTPGTVKAYNPNVVGDMAKTYVKPPQQEVLYGDEEEYAELNETMESNDPEWNKLKRQNAAGQTETITDISALNSASPDMQRVMKKGARASVITEERNYALADANGNVPASTAIRTQFPNTAVSSLSEPANNTDTLIDPRSSDVTVY